ncbi:Psma1 [Symbiodinium necroappetens]|uniref:Psma1 protein n=1 Tax=Symbiodinium necroappetens TaxID=1628268 RepID=A0A812IVI0_9DINO|nr:Psma1 [Symbiodinium necroappetens]
MPEKCGYTVDAKSPIPVFGVLVAASPGVAPETLRHAASVLAEFLDQDQDGVADVPEVTRQLQEHQALILILADEDEYLAGAGAVEGLESNVIKNDNPRWNCSVRDVFVFSELFQTETGQTDGEDAAWEELLHLITHVGYGCAFPERWGFHEHEEAEGRASSELSRALDAALGSCPASYTGRQGEKRADCHYFYEDPSCFYPWLVNEYLFQVWRTRQGGRPCSPALRHEYSYCTQDFRLAALPMKLLRYCCTRESAGEFLFLLQAGWHECRHWCLYRRSDTHQAAEEGRHRS